MSQTTTTVQLQGREIAIIGTAHVSRDSVDEVCAWIEANRPDHVCVEIDAARYNSLVSGAGWSQLNIYQVIRSRKGFLLLGNLVLSSFQKRIGMDLGVKPGEEMRAAIETAQRNLIPYSFCDRDIQTTLKRAWAMTGFWGKNKLLAALLSSVLTREKFDAQEIENLKQTSAVESMMAELADYLPSVKHVLIDERDRYLATRIFESRGDKTVAVVGAGHVPGIVAWLERLDRGEASTDLDDISDVPAPRPISKVLPYVLPALILGLIVTGFVRSGWQGGVEMLWRWFLVNGTLSAIGALIALAHPVTIIASFLAAPITSMNPTIGVGMVSGLMEAGLRKPRVIDFETLQDDILTVGGFFRNRLTHILLVFFFSTLGSAIGTFIALPFLFPQAV
ncbi:MAG: TraB/GumN family protein [Spirochaetaceae bacterium]|nr:MAG: TraB/GumN family protein [Spirochaetaceae bacterium]